MSKRRRVFSSKKDRQCREQCRSIDRISELPDEILVIILSFLTVREAIATSVLSSRWRNLWIFIHRLDFDGMELLMEAFFPKGKRGLVNNGRSAYVGWVNHILALHKNSTIEEFRVFFNLNKTHESCIDEWLKYALARKVQRLELNLTDDVFYRNRKYDECYTFPYKLLGRSSNSLQSRSMGKCEFKYIRKISLNYVNVDGDALKFFLCNCPLLEELSVSQSGELSTLKIIGPFPSFKCLEICSCHKLKSVEIRDANLVYLKYRGNRIKFLLRNVPFLVELLIGGMLTDRIEVVLSMFSRILPQLEIFMIDNWDEFPWENSEKFYSAVRMSNLKQLVVKVDVEDDNCLLRLTNFIRAAPRLQKFVVETERDKPKFIKRSIRKIVNSYPHLKEVKFVGYCGVTSDLELVMHFLDNVVSLEKILIDPTQPCLSALHHVLKHNNAFNDETMKEEMDARTRAKNQLTSGIVPSGITLEIL